MIWRDFLLPVEMSGYDVTRMCGTKTLMTDIAY
jgi:hypothetical protein